jgi:hypothetical protein
MRTKCRDLPETVLRGDLAKQMKGHWEMTWHEDREVNPGVPDLSFVMFGGTYETGWLELKAIEYDPNKVAHKFTLEPSQHRWIQAHHDKIPVYLYMRLGDKCDFLISGKWHAQFLNKVTVPRLEGMATAIIQPSSIRTTLPKILRTITDRRRDEGFLR